MDTDMLGCDSVISAQSARPSQLKTIDNERYSRGMVGKSLDYRSSGSIQNALTSIKHTRLTQDESRQLVKETSRNTMRNS